MFTKVFSSKFFIEKPIKIYAILGILVIIILVIILLSIKAFADTRGVKVPIIMYHSVLKDESKSNDYVITPVQLEKDLVYLKEKGYNTVFVSDLVSYVYDGNPLPENPVIISFDDGSYNNYTYVLPLLEKYDMKAVWSVVGEYSEKAEVEDGDNPNYSYLNWSEISEMNKTGRIEIANHSFNLHSIDVRQGSKKLDSETYEQYQNVLIADLCKLQSKLKSIGIEPSTFTYPYGLISPESFDIVKSVGFKASLSCREKMNYITKDTDNLYLLGRFNRTAFISTEDFMKKALK